MKRLYLLLKEKSDLTILPKVIFNRSQDESFRCHIHAKYEDPTSYITSIGKYVINWYM